MSDLISRQVAIDAFQKKRHEAWEDLEDDTEYRNGYDNGLAESMRILIDDLPSAQPKIIRCKDCKYYEEIVCFAKGKKPSVCVVGKYPVHHNPDWYCAEACKR